MAIEYPKKERDDGDTETWSHPAYGAIRVSRVSGNSYLFGSDFRHQYMIGVTIMSALKMRTSSREWHYADNELVTVYLSEAQWASFISSLNLGSGVPCTLERMVGRVIPDLPPPEKSEDRFQMDMKKTFEGILDQLSDMQDRLAAMAPKKAAQELAKECGLVRQRLVDSTGWVAKQFDEHMEGTVEKAKAEVNAYVQHAMTKAGLPEGPPVLSLEHREEE